MLLVAASFAAFGRIAGNDFINCDDTDYLTGNNYVQSGINPRTIKWAFTTVLAGNWQPLTLISHSLDWQLFGADARGHHIVSLLLHIGAALFLFFFLNKTTNSLWPSAFAAAFFALHPLRVESVAWAAERKDVLSMFFGMASLYAYAFYSEKPGLSLYLLGLILFALALMAKPMLVSLPFALLLLDYWPLRRWQNALNKGGFNSAGKLVLEKIPFICLAAAISILTIWTQNQCGTVANITNLFFTERVANAIVSYATYVGKTFWPVDLVIFYPYERPLPPDRILVSALFLTAVTVAVIYGIKKLPFLFVGWFWYLGTLLPVIGLVAQVGGQARADRYTYFPSVGLAFMLSWGIPLLFRRRNIWKKVLFPLAIVILSVLGFLTWRQCGYWKNSISIFSHALTVTENNYLAHANLGFAFFDKDEDEKALYHYNKSILINPRHWLVYLGRGSIYLKQGLYDKTIEDYTRALKLRPFAAAGGYYYNQLCDKLFYNRGIAYYKLGQYRQAIDDFNKTISLNPAHAKAYYNRGALYANQGKNQLAINDFDKAISLQEDCAAAYKNRAIIHFRQGDIVSGCKDAEKACELKECKTLKMLKDQGYCR